MMDSSAVIRLIPSHPGYPYPKVNLRCILTSSD